MLRKFILISFLAGSLIISALIFFQKTPDSILKNGIVYSDPQSEAFEKIKDLPKTPESYSKAITGIAAEIAQQLVEKNPDGPSVSEDQYQITALDPKKIAEKISADKLNDIDLASVNPKIDVNKLKIVPDSDNTLKESYSANVNSIINGNFSGISADFSNPKPNEIEKLVSAYNKSISALYSLNIPAILAETHAEQIRLLTLQRNLFDNIFNFQKDPALALLSMRLIPKAYEDYSTFTARNRSVFNY